jgi:hypothetical protein
MNKADIWDMCVKQNIFEGYQDIMLPKIQEIFEKTLENNINDSNIIEKIRENLKEIKTIDYKDLMPKENIKTIDFSDKDEGPISNIEELIKKKQDERNLYNDISLNNLGFIEQENTPQIQNGSNPIKQTYINDIANINVEKLYKLLNNQNELLEKIVLSQITILEKLSIINIKK